jgi:cell wall-associated NlpC family hydrolase/3D (Asp-Asp-Asp) domain-containing protein
MSEMIATRYKPQAKVTFYSEKGNLVVRGTSDPKSDIDQDIVSIRTVRDMGADAPTFSINLTRRRMWHKWITANDLVIIEMQRPPEKMATIFVGLVDDTRKQVVMSEDSVQRIITVTGRGLNKAFIKFDIGYVPEAEVVSPSIGYMEDSGVTLSGSTPDKIMAAMLDKIAKKHVNYKWGNKTSLFNLMDTKLSSRKDVVLKDATTLMNFQGSIWAFMKELADEPFHEVFWEINKNGRPELVLRPTPFSESRWESLPYHEIEDKHVVNEQVGRSDLETYTLYSVGTQTAFSNNDPYHTFGYLPQWYKPYADKYGLHRLHVDTLFAAVTSAEDTADSGVIKNLQTDLFNWNIHNNSFYNGSIQVLGSNQYKIGNRLRYKSIEDNSNMEYYITSVTNTFVNFGTWTTELGVTRGMKVGDRFKAPYGKAEDYKGIGIVKYDPEGAKQAMLTASAGATGLASGDASGVIAAGQTLIGKIKYQLGGPGMDAGRGDCSQFTRWAFQKGAGIDIGVPTGTQVQKGQQIAKGSEQPGDLIFFKGTYNSPHIYGVSHVGIVVGNGQMIDCGSPGVSIRSYNTSYWNSHFLMFRRVLTATSAGGGGAFGQSGLTGIPTGKSYQMTASAYGATALNLEGGPGWVPTFKTASGTRPTEGRTIAVDRRLIPLGTKVRITCPSYPQVNGVYVAEDVGGAIKSMRIDIYFDDMPPKDPHQARKRMLAFGMRKITVEILK